jgi:hypothetical protein
MARNAVPNRWVPTRRARWAQRSRLAWSARWALVLAAVTTNACASVEEGDATARDNSFDAVAEGGACDCGPATPDASYPAEAIPGYEGAANQPSYQTAVRRAAGTARERIWNADTVRPLTAEAVKSALLAMHCHYKALHRRDFFQFTHMIQLPWSAEVRAILQRAGVQPSEQNQRRFPEVTTGIGNFQNAAANYAKPSDLVSIKHLWTAEQLEAAGFDESYLPMLISKDRDGQVSFHLGTHIELRDYTMQWLADELLSFQELVRQVGSHPQPTATIDLAEDSIARIAYVLANAGLFHSGNWGIHYILVTQARQLLADALAHAAVDAQHLRPRTSSGLDYYLIHADDREHARDIYRAWARGAMDAAYYSPLGGNLRVKYRAPDSSR